MKPNLKLTAILTIYLGCTPSSAQQPTKGEENHPKHKTEVIQKAIELIESGKGFKIEESQAPIEGLAGNDQFTFSAQTKPDSTWCKVQSSGREITYYLFRSKQGEGHDSIIGIDNQSGFIGIECRFYDKTGPMVKLNGSFHCHNVEPINQ